ncbi:MAG: hypothetical protein HYR96_02120 [Deltaproteobacteria bacterium]|nr:hypothetical protein [Deltaproteobacteria bacterium]MBI3295667.1 hypothetical protein [Deltaproteobacteria bacterium]
MISSSVRRELAPFTVFLALLAATVTIWLVLGWRPSKLLMAHDGVLQYVLHEREISEVGGRWVEYLYRPTILGGVKGYPLGHVLPLMSWLAAFSVPHDIAISWVAILLQVALGFLCAMSASDFVSAFENKKVSRLSQILIGLLCGFAPIFAWRLSYGHINLMAAVPACVAVSAVVTGLHQKTLTLFTALIALAALHNGLASAGLQLILYSVTLGVPIWIGFTVELLRRDRSSETIRTTLVGVATFLVCASFLSAPRFWGMLTNASGGDSARSLSRSDVTYSYLTSSFLDWWASVPWAQRLINEGREFPFWHEVNYPVGPFLVVPLLFFPTAPYLSGGLVVSTLTCVFFSCHTEPISSLLLHAAPPLGAFRVPARAAIVFLPWFATLSVPLLSRLRGTRRSLGALGLGVVALSLSSPATREVMGWTIVLAPTIPLLRRHLPLSFALASLSLLSVLAFQERLLGFPDRSTAVNNQQLGEALRRQTPALNEPLSRVTLSFSLPSIDTNAAFDLGVSTLDGYWTPLKRFAQLVAGLQGYQFDPGATVYKFTPTGQGFSPLSVLYNINWNLDRKGEVILATPISPSRPVWFPERILRFPSAENLGASIRPWSGEQIYSTLALNDADPIFQSTPRRSDSLSRCAEARAHNFSISDHGQRFSFAVETPAPCVAVVATNFIEEFRAFSEDGRSSVPTRVFPSYGSLVGVEVPSGSKRITIVATPNIPIVTRILWFIGLLGSGVGLATLSKLRRSV